MEPKIPAACVQLEANLKAVDDKVAQADEPKLDTERIQRALDRCRTGKAVELKSAGGNNAFLTGPLEMRTGVTLLVDKGVTLFGSRDAALYEATGNTGGTGKITVTAANANNVNAGLIGKNETVNLSRENYFFANADTLYVADSDSPKNTSADSSLGDGGLQKWTMSDGTWMLDYTISDGLEPRR